MHRSGRADCPAAPAAGSGHQASQKPAGHTGQNWAVNGGLDM